MPLWLWQEVQALPWSTEIVALTCGTQHSLRPVVPAQTSTASLLRNTVRDQKDWKTVAFEQFQFFDPTRAPRYMIRDRDRIYGTVVTRRLRAMGIRDKPIAPSSPWQHGFAERLIGSIRRECLDHIVVLGEAHLRRILKSYTDYYNSVRTHRSLHKDAPISRPIHQTGFIRSHPILCGLHHHYVRV
jgi:hypothetical protein